MTNCIQLQKSLYHAFAIWTNFLIAWFERKSSSVKRQRLGISLCDFLDLDHILNIEELSSCLTDIE